MPGTLKPNALCPLCEEPLLALVDETDSAGVKTRTVKRTYYHDKSHPKRRRALPCKQFFVSFVKAQIERAGLEI